MFPYMAAHIIDGSPIIIRYRGPRYRDCLVCPYSCFMVFGEYLKFDSPSNIYNPSDIPPGNFPEYIFT